MHSERSAHFHIMIFGTCILFFFFFHRRISRGILITDHSLLPDSQLHVSNVHNHIGRGGGIVTFSTGRVRKFHFHLIRLYWAVTLPEKVCMSLQFLKIVFQMSLLNLPACEGQPQPITVLELSALSMTCPEGLCKLAV